MCCAPKTKEQSPSKGLELKLKIKLTVTPRRQFFAPAPTLLLDGALKDIARTIRFTQ
jgi:hypothetical protein